MKIKQQNRMHNVREELIYHMIEKQNKDDDASPCCPAKWPGEERLQKTS